MNRGMSAPALWLLGHLAHRNEPLAGDLVEQFRDGRSSAWLWAQILCAIAMGEFRQPRVPVALNLTPIDPIVAEWLVSRRLTPRRVNLSSPVEGVGGLGLMMLGFLLSTVVPDVWWFVIGGIVCGLALGTMLAYRRRHRPMDGACSAVKRSVCVNESKNELRFLVLRFSFFVFRYFASAFSKVTISFADILSRGAGAPLSTNDGPALWMTARSSTSEAAVDRSPARRRPGM